MIIPINDKYRISANKERWVVEKYGRCTDPETKKLVDYWSPITYHQSLQSAINSLAQLMIRTSDAETVAEALKVIDQVTATLCEALEPNYEVIKK